MRAQPLTRRICCTLLVAVLPFTYAHADEVTDWNEIMLTTVVRVPDPLIQVRSATIMHLAVFEAVNAIVGDYDPYLGTLTAARGASPQSAAVAAAHRALVTLHPDQAAVLDAARADSLARVEDGKAKIDGIAVGEAAALAMLAKRSNDGSNTDTPYTPGTEPGQWQPTPPDFTPAFRPGLDQIVPFGIRDGAQFRLRPPPALGSRRYTRDYEEVKRIGDVDSAERPQDRTDVARFYAVTDALPVYYPAARQVSREQGKTLSENARIFALLGITIYDAVIAVFDSKYFYNFWRPVTAIRAGDRDGNRHTQIDPNWAPLVFTPPFPSYPSAHGGVGAAARRVLEHEFGADGHTITLSNPLLPDVVLHYTAWRQITHDIDEARIFGGIHYRFDQEEGARQGRKVGRYLLRHLLRPVHRHEHDRRRIQPATRPGPR
jgi:hypothetical protein